MLAALEMVLRQLVAVLNEWLKADWGLGEPSKLKHHLLPTMPTMPSTQPATPMDHD